MSPARHTAHTHAKQTAPNGETPGKTENLFATIVHNLSDIVCLVDADLTVQYLTPSTRRILGYDLPSMIGERGSDFIHPDDMPVILESLDRLTNGNERFVPVEFRARHADGAWVPLEATATNMLDDPSIQGIVVTARDATERKRTEAALEQSEERFRSIVQHLTDMIWITDKDMNTKYVTPSCRRILGFEPEAVAGVKALDLVHPDDLPAVVEALSEVYASENPFVPTEFRARHADGHWVALEAIASNMIDHPAVEGIIITARDITERKNAQKERDRLEAQLHQAQKMEAVGQLAGGIAHDFNNLLQAIKGYTHLAAQKVHEEAPAQRMLQEVMKAEERATALVKQLLVFSRRQAAERTHVDLNALIHGLLNMLHRVIGEHVQLINRPSPGLRGVCADPGQLEQILVNLCINARDAMPDGGTITIETANTCLDESLSGASPSADSDEFVVLSLSDTGIGIDAGALDHIFEPFYTTKEAGKGTGLGLAVVYGIVKQHDGIVQVDSDVGAGTTFRIYLPASQQAPVQASRPSINTFAQGGNETILLAEDEEIVRNLATEVLASAGYRVLVATDGLQAAQLAEQHASEIDLALLDVVMPGQSGKAVAERIHEVAPGTPVLFSSGYDFHLLDSEITTHGTHAILLKPYGPNDLLLKIREMLDRPH